MQILYVNACVRGEASRTQRIANSFFSNVQNHNRIIVHQLEDMHLEPVNREFLMQRELACDASDFSDPAYLPARQLKQSDLVVIAAPYWDLSFPSSLKVWVEHMFVRNLTFVYRNDEPIGLCSPGSCLYITSGGSRMSGHDWGTLYLQDTMNMLGIHPFHVIRAEGLDLKGADTESIVAEACQSAEKYAQALIDSDIPSCYDTPIFG